MSKRNVVSFYVGLCWTLGFAVLTSAESPAGTECKQTQQPNVIVFLSDDQGWGDLSLNGNRNLSTPNIDGLAAAGASFNRFFVCPVCSPTRAEFLTGRYASRGGVYSTSAGGERLNVDVDTIGDVFKSAGYQTAAFGKWHNGMQYPYHPCGRGFDLFYGFCSGHWGNYFDPLLERNGQVIYGNGFLVDDLTEQAMTFIEKNKADPFLVYLPYNTPHSPMQVPDRFYNKFGADQYELLDRGTQVDREDVEHTKAALAMCENIDHNVGRVLKKLDELAISDNTIVVYFCDNGPNGNRFNGGMKGRKGSTDEGGVRSPLLIRWPNSIKPNTSITQITSAMDLLPTLADMANIEFKPTKPLDGISIKPLLLGKQNSEAWPERVLISYWNKKLSVRTQDYRLDHRGKLFDMVNDPNQLKPVNEKHREIAQRMTETGQAWLADVKPIDRDNPPERPFTVGHPEFAMTQLPARDGRTTGTIKRSNKYPNCSYFTNWSSVDDTISWPVDILGDGEFNVTIYYTCDQQNRGCEMELMVVDKDGTKESSLLWQVNAPHESQEFGGEQDRVPRMESYVKSFKPMKTGTIALKQGKGTLVLKPTKIPGEAAIEFRLLLLERQ